MPHFLSLLPCSLSYLLGSDSEADGLGTGGWFRRWSGCGSDQGGVNCQLQQRLNPKAGLGGQQATVTHRQKTQGLRRSKEMQCYFHEGVYFSL